MKRRTILVLAAIAVGGLATLVWLQSHSVDLVHSVVLNALLQKLPDDYPDSSVEEVFSATRERAIEKGQEDRYLKALVLVSQRLEKRHRLRGWEVDDALELLRDFETLE